MTWMHVYIQHDISMKWSALCLNIQRAWWDEVSVLQSFIELQDKTTLHYSFIYAVFQIKWCKVNSYNFYFYTFACFVGYTQVISQMTGMSSDCVSKEGWRWHECTSWGGGHHQHTWTHSTNRQVNHINWCLLKYSQFLQTDERGQHELFSNYFSSYPSAFFSLCIFFFFLESLGFSCWDSCQSATLVFEAAHLYAVCVCPRETWTSLLKKKKNPPSSQSASSYKC